MAFDLPDLPYAHDALASMGMSQETLEYHHDLHHKHFSCNYALYFRFWDKLMGTDIMESEYDFLQDRASA